IISNYRVEGKSTSYIPFTYDELLHKNWDLASEEQKARIAQIRAQTARMSLEPEVQEEDGVNIINDAPEDTGADIGHCDPEVSANI
ncbi:hypothetical protein LIZ87_20415, partial [Lacrimispora sp. 210928-DFI.3.58]|nr:hypothetical protein [Lacrimispora sp. 210928-DFI.3.58]